MPEIIATQIITKVHSEIYMTNDVLVRIGTKGDALYFIHCGTMAVYNIMGKEVRNYNGIFLSFENIKRYNNVQNISHH
jgi:hypothetical protein